MSGKRRGLFLAVMLAFGMLAAPGATKAAKVTESASGGVLANGTTAPGGFPSISGPPLMQEFELRGAKVKGKQVLDVDLIVSSTGSTTQATADLRAKLVGPKGDSSPVGGYPGGQSLVDLELDDQSEFILCNQFTFVRSDCNYLQGASPPLGENGFFTGSAVNRSGRFNPVFKGLNARGTWTLIWWDVRGGASSTIGEATLQVKTGKKFAKGG